MSNMGIPGTAVGSQRGPIQIGMVTEPSFNDLLREVVNLRTRFQAEVGRITTVDATTMQGG